MAVLCVSFVEVIILLFKGDDLVLIKREKLMAGRVCTKVVLHAILILLVSSIIEDDSEAEDIGIPVVVNSEPVVLLLGFVVNSPNVFK